jgi:hypothetical protein
MARIVGALRNNVDMGCGVALSHGDATAILAEIDALRARAERAEQLAGELRVHAEKAEAELDEAEDLAQRHIRHSLKVQTERDDYERGLGQTIDERDARERQIEAIHEELGCEGEWTNHHDLGTCAAELVAALVADRDAAIARADTAERERDALHKVRDAAERVEKERDEARAEIEALRYDNALVRGTAKLECDDRKRAEAEVAALRKVRDAAEAACEAHASRRADRTPYLAMKTLRAALDAARGEESE